MAEIGSFTSRAHAEMAAGMLDAHGIRAHVRGDDAGGAIPHVAIGSHGYRIAVDDADVDDAEQLLAGDGSTTEGESSSLAHVERRVRALRIVGGVTVAALALGLLVTLLT